MKRRIHAVAAVVATALVLAFLSSTLAAELLLGPAAVAAVKRGILYGLLLLVPALAATGASGFSLGKGRSAPAVARKRRRMPLVAANGLLVLAPSAFFLDARAAAGRFDAAFYAVQVLELCAGTLQLVLLGLGLRDGMRLTGRLGRGRERGRRVLAAGSADAVTSRAAPPA